MLGRQGIGFKMVDHIILEVNGHLALLGLHPLATDGEDVIPAILVEHIGQQRRTQDVTHLNTTQARLDLRHHLLGHHIALHHVGLVGFDHAEQGFRRPG